MNDQIENYELDMNKIPAHIAFIMDGNGRWAKKRMMPRTYGHNEGTKTIRKIALEANRLGVKAMTVYAFSTENFSRPEEEVQFIFKLPKKFFELYLKELIENNVQIVVQNKLRKAGIDMKNKFITTVVATALALTMTFSLANGMDVKAAEITEDSLVAAEDTNVGNESVDIQQQEPVEISELETTENNDLSKSSESITVDESIAEDILATQADTAVVVGTVSDYLTAKGDAKLYNINLPAGVYLQAQLTTPANADLDYDLYLLDAEGNILTGSDYYTYINGTAGTLPEALGYITSGDTATYYLYVLASEGGSVSESFTLDYSVSTACDSYEIDESVRQALAFTYGAGGAYIESRNLSSPIDNDWYVITVPSSRIYDKLKISATTASTNTCSVEVYQNVASEGYQMKRVGSGNTISVSSGKYYIRVSNAKTMENFDDLDIQNYKLSITPILKATGIVITDLKGSEGLNQVVNFPGYGAHFRTQGSGTLTVYGVLTATDSSTGVTYAVGGEQINGLYYSPAWEANNTSANAIRRGTGTTDSSGKFEIDISLPPGIGVYSYYGSTSTHYFDICGVSVSPSDDSSISASETIFHLAYTMYHPF